jgi:hypothetical protein
VALYLFQTFHTSMAVAAYVTATAAISLLCVWVLQPREESRDADTAASSQQTS